MKKLLLLLGIIGILLFSNQAQAVIIVNTGPGPLATGGWCINGSIEWPAAKFSLDQAYSLTDIYGWMGLYKDTSGTPLSGDATISIYGDAGEIPNSADVKYSQSFSVTDPTVDWRGLSGLNWNLSSGNYWVAFGSRLDTLSAYMPYPSINPLSDEAYFTLLIGNGVWFEDDNKNLGVKILGNSTAAIPEPASLSLLGLGLLGLLGLGKKKII